MTEEAKRKEEVRNNNLHRGDLDFFVYQAQSEAQTLSPRRSSLAVGAPSLDCYT